MNKKQLIESAKKCNISIEDYNKKYADKYGKYEDFMNKINKEFEIKDFEMIILQEYGHAFDDKKSLMIEIFNKAEIDKYPIPYVYSADILK